MASAAADPSLRRHDPDQVQRDRLAAVSAPVMGRPSDGEKLRRTGRGVKRDRGSDDLSLQVRGKPPLQTSGDGGRYGAGKRMGTGPPDEPAAPADEAVRPWSPDVEIDERGRAVLAGTPVEAHRIAASRIRAGAASRCAFRSAPPPTSSPRDPMATLARCTASRPPPRSDPTMRHALAIPILLALSTAAGASPAQRDARMDEYLSIWARNDAINPSTVARLYAAHVDYYGRPMSAGAVYRDKLAFVRRWPVRSYAAVPGTVVNDCDDASPRCRVTAVMRWSRADGAGRGGSGTNTVRLDLARENGTLKIVRESGAPVSGRRRRPELQ